MHNVRLTLGLSGGIGCGKSARCRHVFEKLGPSRFARLHMISADTIGHRLYAPGTAVHGEILEAFGTAITKSSSMEIDRKKLGSIVFSDPRSLQKLNAITWPGIKKEILDQRDTFFASGDSALLVLEAALLVEIGLQTMCDEVWLLGCDPHVAIDRIMARDGLSREESKKRVDAQISLSSRQDTLHRSGFGADRRQILRVIDTTHDETVDAGLSRVNEYFSLFCADWGL